jgi:hypothetical protein
LNRTRKKNQRKKNQRKLNNLLLSTQTIDFKIKLVLS